MTAPTNQTVINLPFPPSTNGLFANVPGRGRVRSKRYTSWALVAGTALNQQHPRPFSGPVEIDIYVQDKPDRRRDIDNLAKGPLDLLVAHGVIEGDHNAIVRKVSLEWASDVTGCRVCIRPAEAA